MSQCMLPVKSRKSHGMFCLCEWTAGYKLRPLVRTSLHLPLNTCIWSTTPLPLTAAPSSHAAQYCSVGWLTGTGFYGLPPLAQLVSFSGVCTCPGHVSEAAEHFFFYLGRKDCTLHQDFGKITHNHDLFSISVTKTECWHSGTFYHIKSLHLPRQDCSLNRGIYQQWATHLST